MLKYSEKAVIIIKIIFLYILIVYGVSQYDVPETMELFLKYVLDINDIIMQRPSGCMGV